jgi:predicted ATP-grasp superfamily ATP-dependent carboligase
VPARTVLIAAFSGRALAASARRAGYAPLVVDCFGDQDMCEAAERAISLPARVQVGFRRKSLMAALDTLVDGASSKPIGLVLGAGFECNPRLVARLAERYHLIGNSAGVIQRTKDPVEFFATLDRLGIAHPETRIAAPEKSGGWLMKRIGGSGGLHIVDCPLTVHPDPRRYFQRKLGGECVSVLGVIGIKGPAFAMSRQWTSPLRRRPYRYGGAVAMTLEDADLEARLIDSAYALSGELKLMGLVSFDFIVQDGEPFLIEVNARPGATLDVLDDDAGSLFEAHIAACLGEDSASLLERSWRPSAARAAAYLYADRGDIRVSDAPWPEWSADRPQPGSTINRHQPLATVIADGGTSESSEALCRTRLGLLANMLYEG